MNFSHLKVIEISLYQNIKKIMLDFSSTLTDAAFYFYLSQVYTYFYNINIE